MPEVVMPPDRMSFSSYWGVGGERRTRDKEGEQCVSDFPWLLQLGLNTFSPWWEKELTKHEHKALATLARDKFNMTDVFQDKK